MLKRVGKFFLGEFENSCRVEVRGAVLAQNYRKLAAKMPTAPVLKSNAYGHGLVLAAKIFEQLAPPFLCVDSLYEAYELLKAGIKTEVLIMGWPGENNLRRKRLPFAFAAYDLESFFAIKKHQPQAPVHLFVDTGMNREGMNLGQLKKAAEAGGNIAGLMSHEGAAGVQTRRWRQAEKILESAGVRPRWRHMGKAGNVRRAGLDLYLSKPALRFLAKIVQVKKLAAGDRVGYDYTFTAARPMMTAVVPAGYFEGVDRRLSNKGVMTVGKAACPIVGRVNMNMTVIDVSALSRPKRGDEAVVFSDQAGAVNSVANTAKRCGTIPYDILVHINPLLKRVLT